MFPIFVHVECICNSIGSKDEDCNKITGECSCKVGFTGTNCNGCAIGFTGNTCNECVPGYDSHGGYPNCNSKFNKVSISERTWKYLKLMPRAKAVEISKVKCF